MYSEEKRGNRSVIRRIGAAMLSLTLLGTAFAGMPALHSEASAASASAALVKDYGLAKTSQEGATLHCWNWSYNNIRKYMKDVSAAGYT